MKRTLALTAATLALTLSLAACGAERADGGMSANRDETADGLGGVTGAVNRSRDADGRDGYAIGGPNSGVYSAAHNRGVTQEEAAARSRLERMLENGRVHDTDGFLLDGENAANSTF